MRTFFCFALLISEAAAVNAQVRGGSNYPNFRLTPNEVKNFNTFQLCNSRERSAQLLAEANGVDGIAVDVIFNYDVAKDSIDAELQAMFDQGQRRLRIPVRFMSQGDGYACVYLQAPGGVLPPRFRKNLTDLLASVKRIGFEEVIVGSFQLGKNFPYNWTSFDEAMYNDNWNLIQDTRPIVVAAGLPYLLDLGNELIPVPNEGGGGQAMVLAYSKRQWIDYTAKYGKDDTLGFSLITDIHQLRVNSLPAVYGDNPPAIIDLHFYENAVAAIELHKARLEELGYGDMDWIIGETLADPNAIGHDARATLAKVGQPVRFLTQWPMVPTGPPPGPDGYYNLIWFLPSAIFENYILSAF